MSLLQLAVLDEDLIKACAHLAERRVVHLVDRALVAPALREGTPAYFASVQTELEVLAQQVQTLSTWLEAAGGDEESEAAAPTVDPQQVVAEVKPAMAACMTEFREVRAALEERNNRIKELTRVSDTLQSFEAAGITYTDIRSLRFFVCYAGTMPERLQSLLGRSLHEIKYHIELRSLGTDEVSVILFCLTGHGHFDLGAYDNYLSGKMQDFEHPDEAIASAMSRLPVVA